MKLYTLRHKATGEFMPCRPCSRGTGFTLWSPGDKTRRAVDANPRIFYTLRSAQMAKTAWVRGCCMNSYHGDGYDRHRYEQPKLKRYNDDLEIMFLHTTDWVSRVPFNPKTKIIVCL